MYRGRLAHSNSADGSLFLQMHLLDESLKTLPEEPQGPRRNRPLVVVAVTGRLWSDCCADSMPVESVSLPAQPMQVAFLWVLVVLSAWRVVCFALSNAWDL